MRREPTMLALTALALTALVPSILAYPVPGTFKTVVLGYHVGTGTNDDVTQIPWSHLTQLSHFGVAAQPDGSLTSWDNACHGVQGAPCWTDAKFLQFAQAGHARDVKVGVTLVAVDDANCDPRIPECALPYKDRISHFLNDSTARQRLINDLVGKVIAAGADGVDVDIEWPKCVDATNEDAHAYADFVAALTSVLHSQVPGSYVYVAAPAWDTIYYPPLQVCDQTVWKDLAAASDGLTVMGYGYHGDFSDPGPGSPVNAGSKWPAPYDFDLTKTLAFYTNQGIQPGKLLLGFPFSGFDWPTDTASVPAGSWNHTRQMLFVLVKDPNATAPRWDCERRLSSSKGAWDPVSLTPYAVTDSAEGGYRQLFCESLDSMAAKFQLARDKGIAGVFFWAENYLPHDYPIWKLLDTYSMVTPPPNQAPVVSIAAHGPVQPNTPITMTGTATEPDGDAMIFQWSIPSGPPGQAPDYDPGNTLSVTTQLPTPGYYTFAFTATDGAATRSANTRVLVQGDTQPPTAAWTSPIPGAVSGNVVVNVTASDNIGVAKVDLDVDGTIILTDTTAPYSFPWNTNSTPDGNHTVRARATDWSDLTAWTTSAPTNVDNNGPALAFINPTNGASVTGTVKVNLSASDQAGVAKVEISVNGALKKTLTRSPWTWNWNSGPYRGLSVVLSAKAYDTRSHTSTASVTVTVR